MRHLPRAGAASLPGSRGRRHASGVRPSLRRCLLLAANACAIPHRADPATIAVDTFEQVDSDRCTIASAILAANADMAVAGCPAGSGADTIVLAPGTYALTGPHAGDDGLPIVTGDLTVEGNGATIARTLGATPPFFRILHAVGARLVLKNLTIRGGWILNLSAHVGSERGGGGLLHEGFWPGARVESTGAGMDVDVHFDLRHAVDDDGNVVPG